MTADSPSIPVSPTRREGHGWRWAPAWVLAYVALWPAPGYAEAVMVLGALAAIVRLLLGRFRGSARLLSGGAWALTSALFAAYWLPQAISAIDAVDTPRALREAAVDLRYLPFLWLTAAAVANATARRATFNGLAIIVAIWTLDALAQVVFGTSPLFWGLDQLKQLISGRPMCTADQMAGIDRLSGFLGPCNRKLGVVMASLSPFLLFAAAKRLETLGWLLAAGAIGLVVLLAGARAAWITYALVLVASGWRLLGLRRMLGVMAAGTLVLTLLSVSSVQVRDRIMLTAQALTADESGVDTALSGRAQIWSAAVCMVLHHPINGVGARGFREAYPACTTDTGQRPEWGQGPAFHAHQIVLEVLSETGVIGLLLWLAGAALAWRAWRYATPQAKERARPAMLALAVTVFPLNTHLAFYSTFWGGLTLMLAALYAGSLLARDDE
ncbi:O-antigen ligase [Pseudoxanthomonas mexicana]|uniref:O-antigen ligase family protein n=1 Tax=Pseudoxanthomonas mexicana TaxID=128785 RepID=UPI0007864CDB|nr:O-antigen ligase family protein [Pseudoxanthomonas mexicana]